jgi:hypothetical protein
MTRTPVASPALQVYVPAAVGTPHVVFNNKGSSAAYLGGSAVTASAGLWFPPGAQISYPYAPYGIWAVDGSTTTGAPTTTLTAAVSCGATQVAVTGGTAYGTGQTIALGTATGQEFITVATIIGASGTGITLVNPLLYDHATGSAVAAITGQSGTNLQVDRGVT